MQKVVQQQVIVLPITAEGDLVNLERCSNWTCSGLATG